MHDKQMAELIKALLRLSNTVNELSQDLLELSGVDEGAALDEDVAQAAKLLRAAVQALDAASEFHNAAHKQMRATGMMAADADKASDGSTTGLSIERQPNQSTRRKKP
jgi:signal transduction histidine kinase